jgi:ryanodine receptor 2
MSISQEGLCSMELVGTHICWSLTISGLIIDAFGELRDQLDSVKENMESNCFICGIGKDYFDTVPHGFDTHVAKEHNLANYM